MILNHDFVKYIFTETMTILYFLLKLFINEVKKKLNPVTNFQTRKNTLYIQTNTLFAQNGHCSSCRVGEETIFGSNEISTLYILMD